MCLPEMVENTIKVIDPAILLKMRMHHVGKSLKLNLLVLFMNRVVSPFSYSPTFWRSDVGMSSKF